ncbi:hypothetical protein JL720_5980 [Aureococcus anophagefferens]|nr:hypothetical protein JL720_5980 [Aureococcus anophagefferens]
MERVDIVFRAQKLGIDITYDGGRQAVVVEHFEKGGATLDSATLVAVNGDAVGPLDRDAFLALAQRLQSEPRPMTLGFSQPRRVDVTPTFAVGDRVRARFRRGRKYFPGVVRAVRGAYDVVYDIAYDDGDEDRDLEADFVKAPKEPAAPPEDARPRLTAALDALRTKLGERAAAVDAAVPAYAAGLGDDGGGGARVAAPQTASYDAAAGKWTARRKSARRRVRMARPLRRRGGGARRGRGRRAAAAGRRRRPVAVALQAAAARAADEPEAKKPSPPKPEKKPSPPKRKAKDEPETKKPSPPKRKAKRVESRGVNEQKGRYRATLHHKGQTHRLGSFADERSAAKAYDRACRKHGCPEKCNEVDVCDVCGEPTVDERGDALPDVVLCDACDCETKLACAGLDAMPEGAWYCPHCASEREAAGQRRAPPARSPPAPAPPPAEAEAPAPEPRRADAPEKRKRPKTPEDPLAALLGGPARSGAAAARAAPSGVESGEEGQEGRGGRAAGAAGLRQTAGFALGRSRGARRPLNLGSVAERLGRRRGAAARDRDREALLANFDGWLERELHPAKVGPYRDAVRRFARGDTFDGRGATIALRSLDQALVDELRLCRDDDAGSAKAHGAPHVPSEALEFLCAFVATASG